MKKDRDTGIFAIPNGSTIDATNGDYKLALSVATRKLISLNRHSIAGMDAHDFAVESIMLCHRWGGKSMIPFRAQKLIIDKLREETGIRRKHNIKCSEMHENLCTAKKDFEFQELEDILIAMPVPDKLKYIIRLRVYRGMTYSQISRILEISESGVSSYVASWSRVICYFCVKMGKKDAMKYVRTRG